MPRTVKEKTESIEKFQQRLFDLTQDKIESGGRDSNGHKVYSLDRIAKEIGISKGALSKWQRGEITGIPSTDYLVRIADYYGVNVAWLAGGDEERDRNTTLEKTGLTTSALKNLIEAEGKHPGVASAIISSKSFLELVSAFNYLGNMGEVVDGMIDSDSKSTDQIEPFSEFVEQFKYQRYAVMEIAFSILDEVANHKIILEKADKILDGYVYHQFEENEIVDLD